MPEHGFDFTVVMVIDDLFKEYVGDDDISNAIHIAESVFEEAAGYFTGEKAKNGLGTKLHFILEGIKYVKGKRFESQNKYGEYLQ